MIEIYDGQADEMPFWWTSGKDFEEGDDIHISQQLYAQMMGWT